MTGVEAVVLLVWLVVGSVTVVALAEALRLVAARRRLTRELAEHVRRENES